jgi:hypothetical protein
MSAKDIKRVGHTKVELVQLYSTDAKINSNGDYTFFLNTYPIFDAKTVSLYSYNILWNWNNVTPTTNTIVFKEGAGNLTATIPIGNYSIYFLLSAIGTAMTNAGTQTYTATFNVSTNYITITGSTGHFSILYPNTTMSSLLGLSATQASAVVAPFALTFSNIIDLLPIKELDIRLPGLLQVCESGDNSSLIYAVSLAGSSFGSMLSTQLAGVSVELQKKNLNVITVSIVNIDGFSPEVGANGQGNLTFTLTLQVDKFTY